MSHALQLRNAGLVSMDQWSIMRQQAEILVKSGLLPNTVNSPEKAVAIMLKGQELGIPAMYALSNIVVIQGKPTANAELMLALIYRDHGDNAVIFEDSTADHCLISYSRRAWLARKQFAFTMDDARKANLLSNQTWQKYPAAMLRARAISAVARMAFPDSIGGMYTPEELGAAVSVGNDGELVIDAPAITVNTQTGEIIEGTAREVPAETPWDTAWHAYTEAAKLGGYETKDAAIVFIREQYPDANGNLPRLKDLTPGQIDKVTQRLRTRTQIAAA
jgi:hypothetical protein